MASNSSPRITKRTTFSAETLATLERFGFEDPYDPQFIWTSVFGTKMLGHVQRWPSIDFSTLSQVNSEVVGWVHMDGTPVNYPIVAGHLDRSYYLTHNFSGEESCHGQVQLSFGCSGRIGGRNTVLTAHTMNDWSMFRAVRNLCDQDYFDEHPVIQILTPRASYKGRWFATAQYTDADPWPQKSRFADETEFSDWLEHIEEGNWLVSPIDKPTVQSRILTCTTCAQSPGPNNMRAVFAVVEEN